MLFRCVLCGGWIVCRLAGLFCLLVCVYCFGVAWIATLEFGLVILVLIGFVVFVG